MPNAAVAKTVSPHRTGNEALTGTATGTPAGKSLTAERLLALLNLAIEDSGLTLKVVAADLGVPPPKLTALRSGERPWTLERIAQLPDQIRVDFLRHWTEAEGLPASLAHALRSLADAMDPQGRLPLIGEVNPARRRAPLQKEK